MNKFPKHQIKNSFTEEILALQGYSFVITESQFVFYTTKLRKDSKIPIYNSAKEREHE